jgi:hypothetical protein
MKSIRRSLVGLSLSGVILLAGAPAQAQTTSNGPYYATPSWDQTLPAATRFIILSNFAGAAVLDRNTGLVWEKSPETTTQTWQSARATCIEKNVGGQLGWRLPGIPELFSLMDRANSQPSLPTGHPFLNVQSNFYWSATSDAVFPIAAWSGSFFNGSAGDFNKTFTAHAWCVRGGGPLSEY